ncbi:DNA cytosine methyltransferase [Streptomyces sp. NBC_00102]|uniref:DNA cytosine methyltransferase n=1 Tax=Streptomyces sp. NBC_00102 TaxID=2975652 RepID=UPI00224ED450|nr:DNA cytosine methyltransferase [Streptomyces sp. NBC_00102]MCX5398479.1 DNA cytosine methyltransferase [Streptomyces sp. NBC_00102]
MPILELCAGYGGVGLAVESLTGDRVAFVADNSAAASAVLAERFSVPNLGDISTADWGSVAESVNVLTAGFPCQDISTAGRGAGIHGERSGVWKYVVAAICRVRPEFVFLENVAAIRRRGLDVVLGDLAASGYDAAWCCLRASAIGAPHQRDRWFCVARLSDSGHRSKPQWARTPRGQSGERPAIGGEPRRGGEKFADLYSPSGWWGDRADRIRTWEKVTGFPAPRPTVLDHRGRLLLAPEFTEWLMGLAPRWVTGIPGLTRTEQLHIIGNGVVPLQARTAYAHLLKTLGDA